MISETSQPATPMHDIVTLHCPICGTDFVKAKLGRPQVYCSTKCRNQMRTNRWPERYRRLKVKKCLKCGASFNPWGRQRYCSKECKNPQSRSVTCKCGKQFVANPRQWMKQWCSIACYKKLDKRYEANCAVCGDPFMTRGRTKTCGKKTCITKHVETYRKEYMKKGANVRNIRKHRSTYPDWYVRSVITKRSSLRPEELPQQLVDVKKVELQIKRELANGKKR